MRPHSPLPWTWDKCEHYIRIRSSTCLKHDLSVALLPAYNYADGVLIANIGTLVDALNDAKRTFELLRDHDLDEHAGKVNAGQTEQRAADRITAALAKAFPVGK